MLVFTDVDVDLVEELWLILREGVVVCQLLISLEILLDVLDLISLILLLNVDQFVFHFCLFVNRLPLVDGMSLTY